MKYYFSGLPFILSFVIACRLIAPPENNGQPLNSKIYVANSSSNSISVIDVNSEEVIKTIPSGEEPLSMAFSPDRTVLAVANKTSRDIWLIHTKEDTVISKIPLANEFIPIKLVFGDPNLLLVAVENDLPKRYVIALDLHNPAQIDTIAGLGDISPITGMVVSRKHRILCVTGLVSPMAEYVPHNEPGTVNNYHTKEVLMRATTNGFGAVITPDERYIYVNKWFTQTAMKSVFMISRPCQSPKPLRLGRAPMIF